jgi:hypothetical protein
MSYKVAKEKTFAPATQAAHFPSVEKFIAHHQGKGGIFIDEVGKPRANNYRELVIQDQSPPTDLYILVLSPSDLDKYGFDPLDDTKVWPVAEQKVGTMP